MSAALPAPGLIGVDWGTTHRRGYWLGADGALLAQHEDDEGMLAARGRFAPSLALLLQRLGVDDARLPVVMSGMVGSASGWTEAPYLGLEVPLRALREHLVAVPSAPHRCFIVPGYCTRGDADVDMMRGEETQLLGALCQQDAQQTHDGWYVLPGTHSKWVRLAQGRIAQFATYMTGELFALLGQHGTLAAAAQDGGAPVPEAFTAGLRAQPGAALSNALFGCRARVVSGAMPASHLRSYLSGLLIGAEWRDVMRRAGGELPARVRVIGTAALAERHVAAGAEFGVQVDVLDPLAVYLAALGALQPPAGDAYMPGTSGRTLQEPS